MSMKLFSAVRAGLRAARNSLDLPSPAKHCDALEPRNHLAADLAAFVGGTLPVSVLAGARGRVSIQVVNVGDMPAVTRAAGVQLFASADDQLDGEDRLLTTASLGSLNLRAGRSKSVSVSFAYPSDVSDGAYRLIAVVDPQNVLAEAGTENNTAVSARSVVVARPFIDLTTSVGTGFGGTLLVNRGTIRGSFNVINLGNVRSNARADIRFVASEDPVLDADDVELRVLANQSVSLAPGKSKKVSLSLRAPSSLWNGTFYVLCVTDSRLQVAERAEDNNIGVSTSTFSITGSQTPVPVVGITNFSATPGNLIAGTTDQAFFYVQTRRLEAGTTIKLYEADALGNPNFSRFLVDVFDNGGAVFGDAQAGDGIYSNTFAVSPTVAGSTYYAAVVQGGTSRASTSIQAIQAPTATRLTELGAFSENVSRNYRQSASEGVPVVVALAQAELAVRGNTIGIDPASIQRTATTLSWRSPEGIQSAVVATATQTGIRSGDEPHDGDGFHATNDPVTSGGDCKRAVTLAPYASQFEPSDEADNVASAMTAKGYAVTSRTNGQVSIEDFKNLGQYDAVVITSHGARLDGTGVVILTGVPVSAQTTATYVSDLTSGRLGISGDTYFITPAFISRYSPGMSDTVVYVGACESARDSTMANAFIGNGAKSYVGYTDIVGSSFANTRGVRLFDTLLADKTLGEVQGINADTETDLTPATFRAYGDLTAKLPDNCRDLTDYDVYVRYSWPSTQSDLDTSTRFLNGSVGFACPGGSYLDWSGDDTSAGGQEIVTVDLNSSFVANRWQTTVAVSLRAGWYRPAGGSGPALLTVGFKHKTTGEISNIVQRTIAPGSQSGCAETVVGTATVRVTGTGSERNVAFTLG
jgi:hypothetical protein